VPLAGCDAVTVAPCSTAPEKSRATPAISPVLIWLTAVAGQSAMSTTDATNITQTRAFLSMEAIVMNCRWSRSGPRQPNGERSR
jgi:hypothetical protein